MNRENLGAMLLSERAKLLSRQREARFDALAQMGLMPEEDRAQVSRDEFISIRLRNLEYAKLRQINAALDRIRCGDYGICQECGYAISVNRLMVIPWASHCVTCGEKMGTNFGRREPERLDQIAC